ncbi:hypothetical protein ACH5RR_004608 [Cinchona calisaya]|uniref:DUF4378 domain-containing protein n=1 Tax=Cinchona calisaya TaxID=153742 RepID=A0ABD3AY26_9GENT
MAAVSAQKHLHELLREDQEPFHLKKYIADRRCQLKRPNDPLSKTSCTSLQIKKYKPITGTSTTVAKRNLRKHACFFSIHDSPDVRKSPFLDFHSPAKSPCRRNNQNGTVFLHVPSKTAALLLEAAMRIQKQQNTSSLGKPKSQIKNMGLGLFTSILKKLKDRSKSRKGEKIRNIEFKVPRKSDVKMEKNEAAFPSTISCSCNNSRLSSAGWSESNEEKSLDMETSTSTSGSRSDEEEDLEDIENLFSSSPFRFSLQRSPSLCGSQTPEFSSPAASPSRHKPEDKNNYEENGTKLKEEEQEQCSPVSVLDPPFQDEDEEDDGHEENEEAEDYDLEGSFAIVQRAKEQLLCKLRRFEKLAELDPVELEKRMMEELDDEGENEDQSEGVEEEKCVDNEILLPLYRGCSLDSFVSDVCSKSILKNRSKIPADMKRLVSDLISEEKREIKGLENSEIVIGRVCKKLNSWKEVESNTIDMMVELDFRKEFDQWKRFQEQREETGLEIELAIFQLLVTELSEELL